MTIVERVTIPLKLGKEQESIEMLRQIKPWYDERNIPIRVYTAYHALYDVVVVETDHESLAALEKTDIEFWAHPFIISLIPKWNEQIERGRSIETWVLHEL